MFNHERIKILRKALGFKSREKFAKEIGIPFPTLRAYEQGVIENIPHSFFTTLSDKFNVNINWLISGDGNMFAEKRLGLFSEDTRRELNELSHKEDEEIIKAGVRDFESYKNYKKSQMKDGEDIDEYKIGLDYKFFLARNTTMELYGIDDVTVGIIKEAYNKAVKNDDLKGFRIHLMDY